MIGNAPAWPYPSERAWHRTQGASDRWGQPTCRAYPQRRHRGRHESTQLLQASRAGPPKPRHRRRRRRPHHRWPCHRTTRLQHMLLHLHAPQNEVLLMPGPACGLRDPCGSRGGHALTASAARLGVADGGGAVGGAEAIRPFSVASSATVTIAHCSSAAIRTSKADIAAALGASSRTKRSCVHETIRVATHPLITSNNDRSLSRPTRRRLRESGPWTGQSRWSSVRRALACPHPRCQAVPAWRDHQVCSQVLLRDAP